MQRTVLPAPKLYDKDEIEIIDYCQQPKEVTADDYDMNSYSAKSSLSSLTGGILKTTQRKQEPEKHSLDSLARERKAMTINFIQNNYTTRDHKFVNQVINEQY